MPVVTVGITARLTKPGEKDISLVVHAYNAGRTSPCVVIENGINLGMTGGFIPSLEHMFQTAANKHLGYAIENRSAIVMEVPDQAEAGDAKFGSPAEN